MEENDAGDGLSKVAIILLLLIMSPNYTQAQDDGWLGLHQAEERETTRVTRLDSTRPIPPVWSTEWDANTSFISWF